MAAGKAIGEFSFKAVTITYSPGPAGSVLAQANWEGTVTGFGAVFSTATYVGGPKSGTFSSCGAAYLDNGDGLNAASQGTYESSGKHRWRTESLRRSPMVVGCAVRARSTWPRAHGRGRFSR